MNERDSFNEGGNSNLQKCEKNFSKFDSFKNSKKTFEKSGIDKEFQFDFLKYSKRNSKSEFSLFNFKFSFSRIFEIPDGGMFERESNERFSKFSAIFEIIE
jgi:hypothetical protein